MQLPTNSLLPRTATLTYPVIASSFYFFSNVLILNFGHFHEDAYILFNYVENLINGFGITYYPGAEPIEGATDFLWLVLISMLAYCGLDTGTAAIALNSIGVLITTWVITQILSSYKPKTISQQAVKAILPVLWIPQSYLIASVGGFSVLLYVSILALTLYLLYSERYMPLVPYLGILLALFRPDGVILGVGLTLSGFLTVFNTTSAKSYYRSSLLSVVVGIAYFLWRYSYFGNILPLPLYVKSNGGGLFGLDTNIEWISNFTVASFLCLVIYLSITTNRALTHLRLAIPALLLFFSLIFAKQSQNVGYRFQAPVFVTAFMTFIFITNETLISGDSRRTRTIAIYLAIFTLLNSGLQNVYSLNWKIIDFNYINEFPQRVNSILKKKNEDTLSIVLTEAGRMAYWNQDPSIKIYDAVGLNTVYPAKNTIDVNYITRLKPDIIFYHHARCLPTQQFESDRYIRIDSRTLFDPIKYENKQVTSKVSIAARALSHFLYKNFDDYDVILVDDKENGSYFHVYAIRKALNMTDLFLYELNDIFIERQISSYYQMKENRKKTNTELLRNITAHPSE